MDRELQRIHWSHAQVDAYAAAERQLCRCEALCTCRWNDPDSLAMQRIARDTQPVASDR